MIRTCAAGMILLATAGAATAQISPQYFLAATDAVTGDNAVMLGGFRYYSVDAGADSYQQNVYERPVVQTFERIGVNYVSEEYHGYVDITEGRFGYDNRYVYASIKVFSLDKRTKDGVNSTVGLDAKYTVRFGIDPDGRNSILLRGEQPQFASFPNTVFTNLKTEGWRDTDLDVGGRGGPIHGRPGPSGLGVTKTDNPLEEFGLNGYDQQFIVSDGLLITSGQQVLRQRVSPTDPLTVEIAFDYVAAGYTRAQIEAVTFVEFEAVAGDPTDPQNGLWNDKYTALEAGSPNPGVGSDSEFGTQGLGGIYLADTLRLIVPPAPPCPADVNGDSTIDDLDIGAFFAAFELGAATADFDASGGIDDLDITAFFTAFELGC